MSTYEQALKEIAAPIERDEKINSIISRAAHRTQLAYWRAYDIWYGRAQPSPEQAAKIQQVLELKREAAARNEFHELRTRMAKLEAMLAKTDPNFHRSNLDRARSGGGAMDRDYGALDRARVGK